MSSMQSSAGFSGRPSLDTLCAGHGRAQLVSAGGSWPVHSSQRHSRLQKIEMGFRLASRTATVLCAAVVAGMWGHAHAHCVTSQGARLCSVPISCACLSSAELQMDQLTLQPIKRIEGHVQLPGSKSLSNRVLLLAALSEGTTLVKNLLVRMLAILDMHACHQQDAMQHCVLNATLHHAGQRGYQIHGGCT